MNIDGTTLVLFFLSPPLVAGPQKPQKLTTSKIKYKHFGPNILILYQKNEYFGAIIFQEIVIFLFIFQWIFI